MYHGKAETFLPAEELLLGEIAGYETASPLTARLPRR
jgi:hypothetical protein